MKRTLTVAAVTLIAGAMLFAQGPGQRWRGGAKQPGATQVDPQKMQERRIERLGAVLELTEEQKVRARDIFANASEQRQALRPQVREAREALRTATQTGTGDVDALAANLGALMGQMHAIHAKAAAEFNSVLTPAQREKVENLRGAGFGKGRGFKGARGGPR